MQILVFNGSDGTRCSILVAGTATVYEVKEKVAAQTKGQWPVEAQDLRFKGDSLADEISVVAQGVCDRDRIELCAVVAAAAECIG